MFELLINKKQTTTGFPPVGDSIKITQPTPVANDYFGCSTSITDDGGTIAVGSYGRTSNKGAVFIFNRVGNDWVSGQVLVASNGVSGDKFGYQVKFSGDGSTLFVCAYGKNGNVGAVYVFTFNGTIWAQVQIIEPSDQLVLYFGEKISCSYNGSRVMFGCPSTQTASLGGVGRMYLYHKSGATWYLEFNQSNLAESNAYFGSSVAISSDGNHALLGCKGVQYGAGAVTVYNWNGTTWVSALTLKSSDYSPGVMQWFGSSIAMSSDSNYCIIGANTMDTYLGGAYVFKRNGLNWIQESRLPATGIGSMGFFGTTCAISNDGTYGMVGAIGRSSSRGASYIFVRSGTTWSQSSILTPTDAAANDVYGVSLEITPDKAYSVIGAYGKLSNKGAVYIRKTP